MTDETDFTDDEGSTPSQQALDSQQAGKALLERTRAQGGLDLARTQIAEAVRDGADPVKGREILGTIDEMERYPDTADPESAAKLYNDHKAFIRSPGAASQAAQSPAPTPRARKTDINKARADYAAGRTDEFPG